MEDFLDRRSQRIFQLIVDSYIESGEPVGSSTLSRRLSEKLSPATIRNVMAHLEKIGLLYSPHTSAGRLPTEQGIKLYVQGMLDIGPISDIDRQILESRFDFGGRSLDDVLEEAITTLTGLSQCTGIVTAPTYNSPLKHAEFIYLSPGQALVVMVSHEGMIENRIMSIPEDMTPSHLVEAGNYLSSRLVGKTLDEAKAYIKKELEFEKDQLHALAKYFVEKGLAMWGASEAMPALLVKGQSNLLNAAKTSDDVSHVQRLFESLEKKADILQLLDSAKQGEGVQVFMGANSPLFHMSGCSMVVAPYRNSKHDVIGAIGVLGPARQNYGRIIPMVNYAAKLIEKFFNQNK
ncbi:MAG: heat-inducible transcriptional repressor HrcA [Candidatus Paracaedibacteraceae bacterium]|nr:heat-inducible transcriptional repressor HrcA [Candidatus Paracaedibacteraceae bacterium]